MSVNNKLSDSICKLIDEWTSNISYRWYGMDYRHKELLKSMYRMYIDRGIFNKEEDLSNYDNYICNKIINDMNFDTILITPEDVNDYKICYESLGSKKEKKRNYVNDKFFIEIWDEFINPETNKKEICFLVRK